MKLINPYEVEVGPYSGHYSNNQTNLYLEDDDGQVIKLVVPRAFREQYEWLSARNGFEQLVELTPDFSDNRDALARAQCQNVCKKTGSYLFPGHPNYIPAPAPEWAATWRFKDKDLALLFKLTFGGAV